MGHAAVSAKSVRTHIHKPINRGLVFSLALAAILIGHNNLRAEDKRSFGLVERTSDEDPSCEAVNRAYESVHNSGRMVEDIYKVNWPDQVELYAVDLFDDAVLYERILPNGAPTKKKKRYGFYSLHSSSRTKFQNCRPLGRERAGDAENLVYAADWSRFDHVASAKVWISTANGKIVKTQRDFEPGQGPDGALSLIDIYSDDRGTFLKASSQASLDAKQ